MECGVEENGSRKLSLELETETSESETKTPESDFNTLPSKKIKIPESENKNPGVRNQKPSSQKLKHGRGALIAVHWHAISFAASPLLLNDRRSADSSHGGAISAFRPPAPL